MSVCNSMLSIVFSHNFNLSILSAKASLANIRKDIVNIIDAFLEKREPDYKKLRK